MQKWNIASTLFQRKNEKPEQLNDSLIRLELHIDHIKHVCQLVGKKLLGCLQLHGVELDKRLRKLPDYALSRQLQESSTAFEDKDALKKMLISCSNAEERLAKLQLEYEDSIENNVLQPLQQILERDIPAITKFKKQVTKQAQEVEAFKTRERSYAGLQRQTIAGDRLQDSSKKLEQAREDLEEAEHKLEQYKDQLATEMFNFYSREGELNSIFISLIESQLRYHSEAVASLQKSLPEMKHIADQEAQSPVFGCNLEEHLQQTNSTIAVVIKESVAALCKEGLHLEGLFRIAGGSTKTKKLKAAFDAGMVDMEEYITDPHCVAGALKLYLRELPEPLMTFDLYDDWVNAAQLSGDQRINTISNILKKKKVPTATLR